MKSGANDSSMSTNRDDDDDWGGSSTPNQSTKSGEKGNKKGG